MEDSFHDNVETFSESEKIDYLMAKVNELSTRLNYLERIYYTNKERDLLSQ
tara:strand:- start:337 stop:489 length:153 start_codon:yes stop_codon:yes gene_type:complete